jgi:large subunit ribosomal protein L10
VLRRKLRDAGVDFRVVKNTLARMALEKAGRQNLAEVFSGPTAVVLGYDDISEPAKQLADYLRVTRESPLMIKSGFLGDQLLTKQQVSVLATLPDRDALLANLMGTMQAPVSNLVNGLAGIIRGMVNVLQARKEQLEKAA